MNILLVDDDPEIRFLAEFVLEQSGDADVSTAETATEALQKLGEMQYDGILLDVMLPDTSGIDFFEQLTNKYGDDLPPVIFLTAKEGKDVFQRIQALGAAGMIRKPFIPERFARQVMDILGND